MIKRDSQQLLDDIIRSARRAGADAADALLAEGVSASVGYRLGRLEDVERAESAEVGLRVFVGHRVAFVSSTDLSEAALSELPSRAVSMARLAPENRFACLAPAELLAKEYPELRLEDFEEPSADTLVNRARNVEEAALAVQGITNSEGGGAGFSRNRIALATSEGFFGRYGATSHNIGVAVLAGEGTAMERDYDTSSARHSAELEAPEYVGRRAAERTVARLHPRKVKSQAVPVVYEPRVASGLLSHFVGAISGAAVARGVTFLKDLLGTQVFSSAIRIVDDPHRPSGLRSKPFDGEGVRNRRRNIVDGGVLQTWLLDCATANQLGLVTTGHAARGTGGPPSPSATNFYMEPGAPSRDELLAGIQQGLYVTELIGMGVNGVTGDYSRGAAGFWIENGKITYPVSGITIAGNLKDMFATLAPASDLEFRYGINAPTLRVEGMTVAGS